MKQNKIEINRKQILTLLGNQIHKFSCKINNYKFKNDKWESLRGVILEDGYLLIDEWNSKNNLIIKKWINKEELPENLNIFNERINVSENIIFNNDKIKFFIRYQNYQEYKLEFIIEHIQNNTKEEYSFLLFKLDI